MISIDTLVEKHIIKKLNNNVYELNHLVGNRIFNIIKTPENIICLYSFYNKMDNFTQNLLTMIMVCDIQFIDNLPKSLKILDIHCNFNNGFNNLPTTLINFKLYGNSNSCYKLNKLPNSVVELLLNCKVDTTTIPKCVKILKLDCSFEGNLDFLPEGIKILKLNINKPINDLPSSIEEILIHEDSIKYINKIYHHKTRVYSPIFEKYRPLIV